MRCATPPKTPYLLPGAFLYCPHNLGRFKKAGSFSSFKGEGCAAGGGALRSAASVLTHGGYFASSEEGLGLVSPSCSKSDFITEMSADTSMRSACIKLSSRLANAWLMVSMVCSISI